MKDIAKRLLNVATVVLVAFFMLVTIITIDEGFTRAHSMPNLGFIVLGIAAIAATNYIFFGKITLWHHTKKQQ